MLNEKATAMINELISKGWHFNLFYTDSNPKSIMRWEADFTRPLGTQSWTQNCRWDNHQEGIHKTNPSIAVITAYKNVKDGKKFKARRR